MNVPFLDLKAQYAAIKNEIHAAVGEVMEITAFAGGPFVAGFEQAFARFCGCKHAVGVGNGTDALWLSLLALVPKVSENPEDDDIWIEGVKLLSRRKPGHPYSRMVLGGRAEVPLQPHDDRDWCAAQV